MAMETPFATDQFVSDFTIVIDNDYEAYTSTMNSLTDSLVTNSEQMREGYEKAISEALDVLRQNPTVKNVTADIMSQMLLGWGTHVFDRIARHYMDKE
jgi:formiminotetrahydrofolate cyclodeaminase